MHRPGLFLKLFLYCLALFFIYPLSPTVFKKLISLKEPAFVCPLHTEGEIPIRSDVMGDGLFGARRSGGRRHRGLDIAGCVGEPVFASKSGAAVIGGVPGGMGKYVKISHFDDYVTIYGHLRSITVADKVWVWQGQEIGKVGKTGNANYPKMKTHLHFELRSKGKAQDPLTYIKL